MSYGNVIDHLRECQRLIEAKQQRKNISVNTFHALQDEWIDLQDMITFLRRERINQDPKGYAWDAEALEKEGA